MLLDTAAASRLQLASYYIETYQGKPSWQGLRVCVLTTLLPGFAGTVLPVWLRTGSGQVWEVSAFTRKTSPRPTAAPA